MRALKRWFTSSWNNRAENKHAECQRRLFYPRSRTAIESKKRQKYQNSLYNSGPEYIVKPTNRIRTKTRWHCCAVALCLTLTLRIESKIEFEELRKIRKIYTQHIHTTIKTKINKIINISPLPSECYAFLALVVTHVSSNHRQSKSRTHFCHDEPSPVATKSGILYHPNALITQKSIRATEQQQYEQCKIALEMMERSKL